MRTSGFRFGCHGRSWTLLTLVVPVRVPLDVQSPHITHEINGSPTTQLSEAFDVETGCHRIKLEMRFEDVNGAWLWSLFGIAEATVTIVAFLGGSHWNSTGKPLLLVDPNCFFIEQLPCLLYTSPSPRD